MERKSRAGKERKSRAGRGGLGERDKKGRRDGERKSITPASFRFSARSRIPRSSSIPAQEEGDWGRLVVPLLFTVPRSRLLAFDSTMASSDPGQKYAYWPNLSNKDVVTCTLCGHSFYGGIKRLKQHLAGG
ncbi:unnamed protein product [Miscanthus lutarioriparius]|uniref:BED-type domain-containing protein n=1 Tax=Miscanthus lutarioriparius TaxID=422564 RepID=A0A811RD43_9POAL|nr:unnamed protein product [Miscanthus lutarioriparius]